MAGTFLGRNPQRWDKHVESLPVGPARESPWQSTRASDTMQSTTKSSIWNPQKTGNHGTIVASDPNPTAGIGLAKPHHASGGGSGMSSGTLIAAIVVPIVVVFAMAAGLFFFWRKRRARSRSRGSSIGMREKDNMLGTFDRPRGDSLPELIMVPALPPTTPSPAVRPLAQINGQDRRHSNVPLTPRTDPSGAAHGPRSRSGRSGRSGRSRRGQRTRAGAGGPFQVPPLGSAERIDDDDAVSEISEGDAELETDRLSAVSDLSYQDEEVGRRPSRRNR